MDTLEKICSRCNKDFSKEVEAKLKSGSWKKNLASMITVCDKCVNARKREIKTFKGNTQSHNRYKYAERLAGKR